MKENKKITLEDGHILIYCKAGAGKTVSHALIKTCLRRSPISAQIGDVETLILNTTHQFDLKK